MPLYEYECTACHRRTEKIQKFSDPELTICPYCSGPLERTITAPAFQFSGGGWYKDLYSSSAKPAGGSDSGSSSTTVASDSSSSASTATPAASAPSTPTPTAKP